MKFLSEAGQKYPNLFSPLVIRGKTIKNRIVSSSHSGGPNLYEAAGNGLSNLSETAALYFGAIARGGAGVVNTGHLGVDPRYGLGSNCERFNFFEKDSIHEDQLPVMHMMTDLIHSYGALASIELNHCGHFGTPMPGYKLIGPMNKKLENGKEIVAMDEEEMNRVADYFAEAAWIGKRGGFDIVNIHAGHNWLLGEFFSPIENQRTDQYGGNAENRARFPKMVLDRIREKVGEDMIISVRFSANEKMEGGITMEDAIKSIQIMEETADIVHCSVGMIHNEFTEGHTFPMQYMERGCNVIYADEVKKHVSIPIETVGGINEPEMAEAIIRDGRADLVAMARTFIADPDWAEKTRCGNEEDIRPCIRCLRCLNYAKPPQTGTSICTVNPRRIFPRPLPPESVGQNKHVVVIGGGAAGMQAAQEIANNGNRVTLLEKSDKLGGRLIFSEYMEFKHDIKRYRDYLIHQVEKHPDIEIRLNVTATPQMVKELQADAVIIAAGAKDWAPAIEGRDKKNVIYSSQVFGHEKELGDHVIIIGGGQVGCEEAVYLQSLGKQVDIVEMTDMLMRDAMDTPEERFWTLFFMEHELDMTEVDLTKAPKTDRVKTHLSATCKEITENGAVIEYADGSSEVLEGDTVILATGFRADQSYIDTFKETAPRVIVIGDSDKTAGILNTSSSGYYASLCI